MKLPKLALLVLVAFALRVTFLSDMEFKGDEKIGVETIRGLWNQGFSFLTGATPHSGISHSAGFFHFVKAISLSSPDPLAMVLAIALLNAVVISYFLWHFRKSEKLLLTFAMCATSFALVLGSRKIWQPDLTAPFDGLAFGLFAIAIDLRSPSARRATLALSSFTLVIAGHMYSAALGIALAAGGALFFWLARNRTRGDAASWLGGLACGGLTFAPLFYLILIGAPGAIGQSGLERHYSLDQFLSILPTTISLPSPLAAYRLYIAPVLRELLHQHPGGMLWSFLFWMGTSIVGWTLLFWASLIRIFRNWDQARKDPLVIAGLAAVLGITAMLYVGRVGNHLHYWFGAMPFAYYLVAWAASGQPKLTRAAWACVIASFFCSAHFLILVHALGGFPGEYWLAYGSPHNYFRTQLEQGR